MQTSHCSAASTRPPPAQGSRRTVLSENKARSKRNVRFVQWQIVRFSLYRVRGLFDAAHCGQSGTALTPGGRWLRPLRMIGIISNPNCAVTYMSIGSQCKQITAPPRARGRRPRRAVEERFLSENKGRSKRNVRFAQRQIVRFSLYCVRGLFDAAHCGQSGTALTPGGRCLRALRMIGITSNRGWSER